MIKCKNNTISNEKRNRCFMDIKYIKQPTGYLCGQSCVAMLANVSVDDVIILMNNDKGTSKRKYQMH